MSNLLNTFIALCALSMVSACGAKSATVDIYVHEDIGCTTDSDCDENYGDNTVASCIVETGACRYVTTNMVVTPGCVIDADCDDGDTASQDSCESGSCNHLIRNNESVLFEYYSLQDLLIADANTWQLLGRVRLTAERDESITSLSVLTTPGVWSSLAVAYNGQVQAQSSQQTDEVVIPVSLAIQGNTNTYIEIWGKVRSDFFNVFSATDPSVQVSLREIHFSDPTVTLRATHAGASLPSSFYIRASRPSLLTYSVASAVIANTEQELFKVQVSADANGPIDLRMLSLFVNGQSLAGGLSNLRLRRGSTDLPVNGYHIVLYDNATNSVISDGTIPVRSWTGVTISIVFDQPLAIISSGAVLTLVGTTNGFVYGERVNVQMNNSLGGISGSCNLFAPVGPGNEMLVWDDGTRVGTCYGGAYQRGTLYIQSLYR